ncbi:MAG: PP2C family protein-serine/threonine phosphatase [Sphingobacteriaceae bacterium]|nr:PP2C family protein-serine/threonine phosphatase [Sphingobacteriaceae bacterium]
METSLLDMELQSKRLAELQQQLALKNVQLDAVLQLTQAINYNFSNAALFEIYGYLLTTELRIGRFLLYIEEGDWRKYGSKGLGAERFAVNPDVFAGIQQIKWLDASAQQHYPGFEVLIPVVYKQQPLAYVLIGGFDWPQERQKDLFQYIQAVSNILAVANENRKLFQQQIQQQKIQQELSLAAQMQGLLIPDKLPHDAQIEMSAVYLPHRDVGGDYYDVVKFESGELVFCVADVSGKGIPAALLMSNFQANLRALIHFHPNLRKLVAALNKAVLNITKGDKFITLFIGKLDPRTGLLKYINAGHVPPFLLRAGELTELKEGTTILGMFEELPFLQVGKLHLLPGDVLLTHTDGVSEVSDYRGRAFDMQQLGGALAPNKEESLQTANKRLLEALIKFKGDRNFADDLTVLSLRYLG